MKLARRLRDAPGVLVRDVPRYARALANSGRGKRSARNGWVSLCNRIERVIPDPTGLGVACDWLWGSALHATEVMPSLGRLLMRAALAEWPVVFRDAPRVLAERPKISFVFAHAGHERLPQLRHTLRSIYAQVDVPCECVVVDQSPLSVLPELPQPVVYRHLAKDGVPPGWHKAWAYNVGARLARGEILVFHDGDVCAPTRYAAELVRAFEQRGCEAASLQRFLFYLDPRATARVAAQGAMPANATPSMVFQNWKGGTIAIHREAFARLGGFDEGFVDWGGEDDEFYDRCLSIGHCRSGYLPFVHLWHPPQPDRKSTDNPNVRLVLPWRLAISRAARSAELALRAWGRDESPDPAAGYKALVASAR